MPFDIHMLSVGNADAMLLRYIDPHDLEYVVLIDAGNRGDGEKVKRMIDQHTDQKYVDLAISTHPDDDHIGGFFYLVENVTIKKFWIHDPSGHKIRLGAEDTIRTRDIEKAIRADEKIEKSLKNVLESLTDSNNLLSLIDSIGIDREEPFAGKTHPQIPIKIVGRQKVIMN